MCKFLTEPFLVSAEANPRDQGFPPNSKEEGCTICQDQEEQGHGKVQGSLLQVPLHTLCVRL